jgi:hypothetical protein
MNLIYIFLKNINVAQITTRDLLLVSNVYGRY